MSVRHPILPGLLLALATLAACGPAEIPPTPTLIVFGTPSLTATHFPTFLPLSTHITLAVTYTVTPTIEPPPTHTPSATPTASDTPPPSLTPFGRPGTALTCQGRTVGSNLLVNGGFEGGQHPQESNDIQVPDGWMAFWRPIGSATEYDFANTDGYQRPEMGVISKQPPFTNPPRVMDGQQAFRMTGNQRAFDAGIYQRVAVTPGMVLCLTGSAQAWSNRSSDNPFASTLATTDDRRNANFQLGIDPYGGTDAFASTVLWGGILNIYDAYGPLSAVQLTAPGASVTVFVRGFMLWRFDHNDMYFDDVSLFQIAVPTPTPVFSPSAPAP